MQELIIHTICVVIIARINRFQSVIVDVVRRQPNVYFLIIMIIKVC